MLLKVSALLVGALALTQAAPSEPPAHGLVIRGGRVLDGAGNPWLLADVAVDDGRIPSIGPT